VTGHYRTLTQDPVFAVDQLVEIAIRALSPAVNDTFTALSCIDWLTAGLCYLPGRTGTIRVRYDAAGISRLVQPRVSYQRMVDGAFDKVRQAGRGMPAVAIRQLSSLGRVCEYCIDDGQRAVLLRQAEMIMRASEDSVPEPEDLDEIRARYQEVLAVAALPELAGQPLE
jgi:uncharacterized membrane protein